jgi:hypothetical protein
MPSEYRESEYLQSGVAFVFSGPSAGPVTIGNEGRDYVTRVLVRYPADPQRFSGRVFFEPFNTSAGEDMDPLWAQIDSMLVDNGDAWIGITERASSVEPLNTFDPERYGQLDIASNDLAWDMMRQLGRIVKDNDEQSPLPELHVERLYMGGYSQSGLDTATFAMAIHPTTGMADGAPVYDGYFPAAHSGSFTPLRSGAAGIPAFESAPMSPVDVPVVDVETQSDVEGFTADLGEVSFTSPGEASIRRDDSATPTDKYRLYEIPGAPHASTIEGCEGPASTFPTTYFLRAGIDHLIGWSERGETPPVAQRIELSTADLVSVSKVDDVGNAVGGVRSPFVDVPLVRYEAHSTPGPFCKLAGRETALPVEQLRRRYETPDGYLERFSKSLDATIAAGFLRARDRAALLAFAQSTAAW